MNLPFEVVLASTSPRRQQLLKEASVLFSVQDPKVDESVSAGLDALSYVKAMAEQKACAYKPTGNVVSLVLGADTIGIAPDGTILTKPKNKKEAFAMWQQMSGQTHIVATAVCGVLWQHHKLWQRTLVCQTEVTFRVLSHEDMERYWATGEPCDKAGAYAIQGAGAAWVKAVNGSYSNVVGLPIKQTLALMDEAAQALEADK